MEGQKQESTRRTQIIQSDQAIVVQTDLVSFPVTVTDSRARYVSDLNKSAFEVIDDGRQQDISFFSGADQPVSIGIIFDTSGSMSEKRIKQARAALSKFFETSDQRDEYFLITFSSRAEVLMDRTRDADLIERSVADLKPHGETALFDAIRLGVDKITKGLHPKHALLLISDGDENGSRYTFKEVRRILSESDALLYSICVNDTIRLASKAGARIQYILDGLSEVTGGRSYYPSSSAKLDEALNQIALELRHQYSIAYKPHGFTSDGKWHHVKVKVERPVGYSRVVVRSRAGYYAFPK